MVYEFRFYYRGSPTPVRESACCAQDSAARARAAEALLRMPSRLSVEVWCGERLIYARRRGEAGDSIGSGL